jgi:hypothetical protein
MATFLFTLFMKICASISRNHHVESLFVDIETHLDSSRQKKLQKLSHASWCQSDEPFDSQGLTTPQFMATSIMATPESNGFWRVKMTGEFSFPQIPQNILSSFPYLSACSIVYLTSKMSSENLFCFSIDSYYEIQSPHPSLTIKTYGQITSHGGKIRESDNYISIDLRVRDQVSRSLPQIELGLGYDLGCCDQLICLVKGTEFELCVGKILPGSSFEISLQPIVKKLCRALNDSSFCPLLSSSLSHCVHKRVLETQLSLPRPQYLPSSANPFVFLHIEKTAGSSIRG